MPVIGDTKVIVEALDDTFDRLHEAFAPKTDRPLRRTELSESSSPGRPGRTDRDAVFVCSDAVKQPISGS